MWTLPEGNAGELVRLVNTYRWHPEKIGCVKCGAKRHHRGFTVELADGSLVLLGSKCGAEHFGSWEKAYQGLKDTRRRRDYLLESDRWRHRVEEIVAGLRSWSRQLVLMDASRRRFRAAMTDLHELLTRAAIYNDGGLKLYEVVRSRALESETGKKSGTVQERVLPLGGAEYFIGADAVAALDTAIATLSNLAAEYDNTDGKTDDKLRKLSSQQRAAIKGLEKLIARHSAWAAFFDQKNLETVAYWATTTDDLPGTYRAAAGSLFNPNDVEMKLHTGYATLDQTALRMLTT